MTNTSLQFPFDCNIREEDYRRLWVSSLGNLHAQFAGLEVLRKRDNVSHFLDELNDLDMIRHNRDINGMMWQALNPEATFREEATRAQQAFNVLDSKISASAAIAKNLALYETVIAPATNDTQRMLQAWKRDLKHGGTYLQSAEQDRVRELTTEIQNAETEFVDNVRNDKRQVEFSLEELEGVPDDFLASHSVDEKSRKIHVFGKWADVGPILEYCRVQATRKKTVLLLDNIASPVNEAVLKRLLDLRREKSNLLGYRDWAEFQLEGTMAKTTDQVLAFLESVFDAVNSRAEKEEDIIAKLLQDRDQVKMEAWDLSYGQTLLKSELLPGFEPKDARQYFLIARVFPAVQKITQDLFRIRFEPIKNLTTWLPAVSACLVYDTSSGKDELLGRLFFDIYHRDGKKDGACAWFARPSVPKKQLAEAVLVANLEERPGACMSYWDMTGLLHELGHCVHAMLGKQRYCRFSGPLGIQRDLMEMPSQLLELWLTDKTLFDFAVNQQGERIPGSVLDNLLAAEEIGRGIQRSGQLLFARLAVSHRCGSGRAFITYYGVARFDSWSFIQPF